MDVRKEEYHFYKSIGICTRCHKNSAEPNKVLCMECADEDSKRSKEKRLQNINERRKKDLEKYERLKQNHICTYCKRRTAVDGKTKCRICLAVIKNKRDRKRIGIARSDRLSWGICYICGKNPVVEDKKVCEYCYKVRLESISKIMYLPSENWKQSNQKFFKKKEDNPNEIREIPIKLN